jgi:hypothetical protein
VVAKANSYNVEQAGARRVGYLLGELGDSKPIGAPRPPAIEGLFPSEYVE